MPQKAFYVARGDKAIAALVNYQPGISSDQRHHKAEPSHPNILAEEEIEKPTKPEEPGKPDEEKPVDPDEKNPDKPEDEKPQEPDKEKPDDTDEKSPEEPGDSR
nr:hypothetical transcript [Hymenolepis microstoma]